MIVKNLGKQLDEYVSRWKISYKDLNSKLGIPHLTSYRWRKGNKISPVYYRILLEKGYIKP